MSTDRFQQPNLLALIVCVVPLVCSFTIGYAQALGPEAPVHFADPALKAAVEEALGVSDPAPTDMLRLYTVDADSRGIADLTGLRYATNLTSLSLRSNQIADISALAGLVRLRELHLSDNHLIDLRPLAKLRNLQVLDFNENGVWELTALEELTGLQELSLHHNYVYDITPLGKLTNLQTLSLSYNDFADITVLSGLTELQYLYLTYNEITDIKALSGLTNLKCLDLTQNPLNCDAYCIHMPMLQESNPALQLLVNSKPPVCLCQGDTPDPNGGDVPVYFANRNLKAVVEEELGIPDPTPRDMLGLTFLDASSLSIKDLTGIEYAINLRTLWLSGNGLTDLSPLAHLVYLERLGLYTNRISDLSPLAELKSLVQLDLSNNQVGDLRPLAGLQNLDELALVNNQVSDLSPLEGLKNLTWLELAQNRIHDISPLGGLGNLEQLTLWRNGIDDVSALARLRRLQGLSLAENAITDISPLSPLDALGNLSVSRNPITRIHLSPGLGNLVTLFADSCQLVDISGLEHVKSLEDLYLQDNQIASMDAISHLTKLTQLDLGSNQITDISAVAKLAQLHELYLAHNRIAGCGPITGITSLARLDLEDNCLSEIDAIRTLTSLEYLRLRHNSVSDISALSALTGLLELDLVQNPLNCDAYCVDIPKIVDNNGEVRLSVDPMPESCNCSPGAHRVYYVDCQALGKNNGSSWTNAFPSLQDALRIARHGDEVRVARGVYTPDRGIGIRRGDRYVPFELKDGVLMKGGYAGVTGGDPNARDIDTFRTILSGDLSGDDVGECGDPSMYENSINVLYDYHTSSSTEVDGFTIRGGMGHDWATTGIVEGGQGGGMFIYGGASTIRRCTFIHNYSDSDGGAVFYGPWNTSVDDPGVRLIDCAFIDNHAESSGGAVSASNKPYLTLERCRIAGNSAAVGGGLYGGDGPSAAVFECYLRLIDCIFENNRAGRSSELGHWGAKGPMSWYDPAGAPDLILDGVTISAAVPHAGTIGNSHAVLKSDMRLVQGRLNIISSLVEGDAKIYLGKDAELRFTGDWLSEPVTTVRASIYGPGRIEVDPGQQLIIEGGSVVNLSSLPGVVADPNRDGHIGIRGSLVVRGGATIEGANVEVTLLEVSDSNVIQYNNITLQEASTGFGGEFFVGENARIRYNNIVSEGDRYLDLDPRPEDGKHPTIENNRITVVIKEGKLGRQGTLLELRAKDYDFGTAINPAGRSGAYQVPATSRGFTEDPSENWVLEKLILEPNAKLNLTNRQGFEFQDSREPHPETVYVKELVMGPNSVLNTALQTMYYGRLVDPNGAELARDPDDPYAPLANGARFDDIPVLGFSLGIIAMNDQTEFDVRVRKRLTGSADGSEQPPAPAEPVYMGSIQRVDAGSNPVVPASAGGVMEMCTQAPSKQSARSVAAKGAFARAGDEDITIEFEYLFRDDPYGQAEIIVYLSDHPEVSKNNREPYEVARIYPPAPGRPGSIGSREFARFSGTFLRKDLNFTRGTYVELELRGRGVRCWIDNWDPKISCNTCGDYNATGFVDITDYYLLLAGFGMVDPGSAETRKACLDHLTTDGCVTVADLLSWEVMGPGNACRPDYGPVYASSDATTGLRAASATVQTAGVPESLGPVMILGKSDDLNEDGITPQSLLMSPDGAMVPTYVSGTGRLVSDGRGRIYQVDPSRGIIRIEDGSVVVRPQERKPCKNSLVSVGFNDGRGVALMDAVFHPVNPDVVYVVPVQVTPEGSANKYVAAARLGLTGGGDYAVEELYGNDPSQRSTHTITDSSATVGFLNEPDLQHLQEVEIDSTGRNLFVLSSCWQNQNNWIVVYDAEHSEHGGTRIWLNDPNTGNAELAGPSAMVVSAVSDALYLVSSAQMPNDQDDLARSIYCFHVSKTNGQVTELKFDHTVTVRFPAPDSSICNLFLQLREGGRSTSTLTSLAEDPGSGTLYAVGCSAPKFKQEVRWPAFGTWLFTTPILAVAQPGARAVDAVELMDSQVLLPLSVVCTGTLAESACD
jgi:internalin A